MGHFPLIDRFLQLISQMIGHVMAEEIPDRKERKHFYITVLNLKNRMIFRYILITP